jgi:plastocyanin
VRFRSFGLAAIAVDLALILTSCGSGGGSSTSSDASAGGRSSASSGVAAGGDSCARAAGISGKVTDHGTTTLSGSSIDLAAGDFFFEPTCTRAQAGNLTITVTNDGQALHNFSVKSLGIDQDVTAGQSITVQVEFDGSAPLAFFCKYHVASGMRGALLPS